MGKNYYAIARGRVPGIYTDWAETKNQVHRFKGARFKSFPSKEAAVAWLRENSVFAAPRLSLESNVVVHTYTHMPQDPAQHDSDACGFAANLRFRGNEKIIVSGFQVSSQKRLELMACIESLRLLKRPSKVVIYAETPSIINNTQLGWLYDWRSDKWQKNGVPLENADLWQPLSYLLEKHSVQFKLIDPQARGINGIIVNTIKNGSIKVSKDLVYERLYYRKRAVKPGPSGRGGCQKEPTRRKLAA